MHFSFDHFLQSCPYFISTMFLFFCMHSWLKSLHLDFFIFSSISSFSDRWLALIHSQIIYHLNVHQLSSFSIFQTIFSRSFSRSLVDFHSNSLPLIFFFNLFYENFAYILFSVFFFGYFYFSFCYSCEANRIFRKKNFIDYLKFYQMSPAVYLTISSIEKSGHYMRAKKIQLPIVFYWPPYVW